MKQGALYTFRLTIYMTLSKKIPLNLNWYRNAHYQTLNKTKQVYWPESGEKFKANKIAVTFTLVWNNKRRTDRNNWTGIADKYFLDWLVKNGFIPDDDLLHYESTTFKHRIDTSEKESYIIAEVEVIE